MGENAVVPDKMQFAARPEAHHNGRLWVPDERDGFISWLRGEFAAANAIIDSLCYHMRTTGEPGEYDMVIGSIQQRRHNWTSVLHMQQYFSIAEVMMALQQVAWQKQQRGFDQPKAAWKETRRNSFHHRHGNKFDGAREGHGPAAPAMGLNANGGKAGERFERGDAGRPKGKPASAVDKRGLANTVNKEGGEGLGSDTDSALKDGEKAQEMEQTSLDPTVVKEEKAEFSKEAGDTVAPVVGSSAIIKQEMQELFPVPRFFVWNEMCDGKMANVFEGLKLYDELVDSSVVAKIVSLITTLRISGRKGFLDGQTFVASRKPSKGHGREVIQLGTCIYEGSLEDENAVVSHKEKKVEPIPSLLQDMFERLIQQQVLISCPDYCVVDFFNEGEHSQPHLWLLRYGRPLFHLMLTECDMVFGRTVNLEGRGHYRGSLRLSLRAGSLLVLEGRSADMAKRAVPITSKQRIIVTFGKSQPRDFQVMNCSRQNLTSPPMSSSAAPWVQHSNRLTTPAGRPSGPKNYGMVAGSGVLQVPHIHPQQPSLNGIQPLFVAQTPVPITGVPLSPSVPVVPASSGWTVAPRNADAPRLPVPGTGVFLPSTRSGHSPPHQSGSESSYMNGSSAEKVQCALHEKEGSGKPNSSTATSPKDNSKESSMLHSCKGATISCDSGRKAEEKDEQSPSAKDQPSTSTTPCNHHEAATGDNGGDDAR